MNDNVRYAVGIDIGTTMVRCVVGHLDETSETPTIVGVGQAPSSGMRKGAVASMNGPARAIDDALDEAEKMSGYQVDRATISVNGTHIMSTKADGMIAVGGADHEVTVDDAARLEEVAITGKLPANRHVIEVVPFSYRLDGQDNIKQPVGMTGTRLEVRANVISALSPHIDTIHRVADMAQVQPNGVVPSVLASARSVLTESQIENGVAVVDLGGATTSVAVFEEGDLQYVAVIPLGGVNITNDLAIGLKTDPEIAEKVKLKHATAAPREDSEGISMKSGDQIYTFQANEIDEIVEARLDEIFEAVQKELKKAGKAGQLPSGIVLTGGGANLKGIADYTRNQLNLAAKVGLPVGYAGVVDQAAKPEYTAAVGLMLTDSVADQASGRGPKKRKAPTIKPGQAVGAVKSFFSRFRA